MYRDFPLQAGKNPLVSIGTIVYLPTFAMIWFIFMVNVGRTYYISYMDPVGYMQN